MAWRWAGTMLVDAEVRFERVAGYRDLGQLALALGRSPGPRARPKRSCP